jgi:SPP1 gp7 family putative phage head morphogenesis protein
MAEAQVRALMALARAKAVAYAEPTYNQQPQQRRRKDILPVLILWFGSKAAVTATALPEEILAELASIGIGHTAAMRAGEILLQHPMSGRTAAGSPQSGAHTTAMRMVASAEPELRAEFLINSAERLQEALGTADYDKAVAKEERYAEQHVAAGQNRRRAAQKLDDLAKTTQFCVWRAVMDKHTTPDCAALNGRIFPVNSPPAIPGAVHPRCRCKAEAWSGPPLRT